MAKIFQRIAQVFHNFEQGSILAILNLSLLGGKSVSVGVALLKAIGKIFSWHQRSRKRHTKAMITLARLKSSRQRRWIGAALVSLSIVLSQHPQGLVGVANAATTLQLPFSTNGSKIVDATSPSPSPSPGEPPLQAQASIESDWSSGFCVGLRVTNKGTTSTSNWQLTFDLNQAKVTSTWTSIFTAQGTKYLVTPQTWGQVIQPNQTADAGGYCADKLGSNYKPSNVTATSL